MGWRWCFDSINLSGGMILFFYCVLSLKLPRGELICKEQVWLIKCVKPCRTVVYHTSSKVFKTRGQLIRMLPIMINTSEHICWVALMGSNIWGIIMDRYGAVQTKSLKIYLSHTIINTNTGCYINVMGGDQNHF